MDPLEDFEADALIGGQQIFGLSPINPSRPTASLSKVDNVADNGASYARDRAPNARLSSPNAASIAIASPNST